MKFTILVIDDEENIRNGLASNFEMEDYTVRTASNGRQGLELVSKGDIDLVVTDLRMDGISGEEVLRRVTTETPGIPVIVLTGHGSIDAAVDAMKNGAYDFLTKPLNLDQLNAIVKRALETRELSLKHKMLLSELDTVHSFGKMIGKSAEIQKVFNLVEKVAPSKASVLITGESGVGKELVADAIHSLSPRKNNSFIKVHCAALSESLLESELFGHEKGAFTSAITQHKGKFEQADHGTLFLDEIGDMSLAAQAKVLRVLQEKKLSRVGSDKDIMVDVRVVAATNKNLKAEIEKGNFREDLYHRLSVIVINVPSLDERKDDIPLLVDHFVKQISAESGMPAKSFSPDAIAKLQEMSWTGNIRELRNVVERLMILGGNPVNSQDVADYVSPVQ